MKKLGSLCLIFLLALAIVISVTACGSNSDGGDGKTDPSGAKVSYEITVNTAKVDVDAGKISVCLYSLDGTFVGEKKLSQGKTIFELNADSYVATLSGLSDDVSFSSVLLTKSSKKATITLDNSQYDEFSETNSFAVTVIVKAGNMDIDDLDVQICDDELCRLVKFENGNVADLFLSVGKYEVKVGLYSNEGYKDLYHEDYTLILDKRFCVIAL